MSRYPPTHSSQLPAEYRPYAKSLEDRIPKALGPNGKVLVYKDANGALLGPFPTLIASKEVGDVFEELRLKIGSIHDVPAEVQEIVALVVGTRFQAAFQLYAHGNIAVKIAGLTQQQVDSIEAGKKPADLDKACSVIYDLSYHLANKPGPLPQDLYDGCVDVLGKEGTLVAIHYTAFHCYGSVILNASDVPVATDSW